MRRGDAPREARTRSADDRPAIEFDPDAGPSIIGDDLLRFGVRTWDAEWDVDDDASAD